jgi:hypothetical protein
MSPMWWRSRLLTQERRLRKDGTKILVINNRGNMAVVLWGGLSARQGWVPMFSDAQPNPFLNGGCGSVCTHWMPLPPPPT